MLSETSIDKELMCKWRAKEWESLISFAALFETEEVKERAIKNEPDYDWRVVVAKAKGAA